MVPIAAIAGLQGRIEALKLFEYTMRQTFINYVVRVLSNQWRALVSIRTGTIP